MSSKCNPVREFRKKYQRVAWRTTKDLFWTPAFYYGAGAGMLGVFYNLSVYPKPGLVAGGILMTVSIGYQFRKNWRGDF